MNARSLAASAYWIGTYSPSASSTNDPDSPGTTSALMATVAPTNTSHRGGASLALQRVAGRPRSAVSRIQK